MPPWEFYAQGLSEFPLTAYPVAQRNIGLHRHFGHSELVIVRQGTGQHVLGTESFPIRRGDVFVVPPHAEHGYAHCESLQVMNILFDSKRLIMPEHQLNQLPGYHALFTLEPRLRTQHAFASRLQLDEGALSEIEVWLDKMHEEVLKKSPCFQLTLSSIFIAIVIELARRYETLSHDSSKSLLRLSSLLSWIEKNFHRPITLSELCRRAHMSQSTLRRCFVDCFGLSPAAYLTHIRVQRAEHLLKHTDAPIKQIAGDVGIPDANYFGRVFLKHAGTGPRTYRERARQEHGGS
ncbi:MAG: AraC family transcriptional regulator [Polyangiaceae bacterium]|nr:AraC family transcriptional regulator [Polyangiaceae bacterium]